MKLAIMQPYFFPYIGYFQLINAVDEFVIYDNIEYTKKGWINRNRIIVNGADQFITLPLKKASDYLHVRDRFLSDTWVIEKEKMLNRITESYRKAPYFDETYVVIEKCIKHEDLNLFNFIFYSVQTLLNHLNIDTKLIVSSSIPIDHELKSVDKVIAICKERNSNIYINPIGGVQFYQKEYFKKNNVELQFQKSESFTYDQFDNKFIPWLSIVDVMMFNNKEEVRSKLESFTLIQ